jgi:ATP-binding cassette subfamily B (MDR/TAP) protein 1
MVRGEIEFRDVWFRYPTRKEDFILKGLSIKINPNEQVALVGESGCGKSTFVNLLMRFYDPDFGGVYLDGVNIKDYNLHDLRKAISLVMQEPIIFNYSILENVLYGKSDASNDEVYKATTISNSNEFIEGTGQISQKGENESTSAGELLKQMKKNEHSLIAIIGKKKYKEELDLLKKMEEQENNKGNFAAIKGDVDERDESLKKMQLHAGFEITCGIKGSKLSGG